MLSVLVAVAATPLLPAAGKRETAIDTWIEVDGQVFGCVPDSTGRVGGGNGYSRAVAAGEHRAVSVEQLIESLRMAKPGETVYIPGNVVLDFTSLVFVESFVLHIPGGVTLASNRGIGGSSGTLLKSDAFQTSPLIRADGPGVRLTGLRIQGPDFERRLEHWERSFSSLYKAERQGLTEHQYYYRFPVARGVYTEFDDLEIDNCELSGWSQAAVFLAKGRGHHIHHNHIHSNQRHGLGYGVSHGTAFSFIEYNLFAWNRHSIAGTGGPPSGYIVRNNIELGQSLSHNFDMHGGRDREDGTTIAGSRIEIYNNTFLGKGRAIGIRGRPEEYARIYGNWFAAHLAPGRAVIIDWPVADTVELGQNLYGTDTPAVQ
jgi:hypothetical protein